MKANPGGQIDTSAIIGRERLIKMLWETVEQQSVLINAERRIGKTTVIKKMMADPAKGWKPVFQDLEGCQSASDFAMAVYKQIDEFLCAKKKITRRVKEFFTTIGGTEIGGIFKLPETVGPHWKKILTHSIEDLIHENEGTETKLLFLWDEVPYMLANIRDREGEQTAMDVLDLLRALRQTHAGLRMVMTGSIGLHHVLTSLKDKNYGNAPVNDMLAIEVPPLEKEDAIQLAEKLIEGERLKSSDTRAAATSIANEADCFPFYVHHIVKALKIKGLEATPSNVTHVVAEQLVDANDPWELIHYRVRIPIYYGDDQKAVFPILDALASQREKATVDELLAVLKAASTFDNRDRLLRLLPMMERDHYLHRETDGRYRFRFPLIRRWWKIDRSL